VSAYQRKLLPPNIGLSVRVNYLEKGGNTLLRKVGSYARSYPRRLETSTEITIYRVSYYLESHGYGLPELQRLYQQFTCN